MSEPDDAGERAADVGVSPASDVDELERLRRLILAVEQERLAELERRLNDPDVRAEELATVMPEALARASHHGNRLGLALSPAVEEALGVSIRKNRKHLAEALAPAMGPAIRRAIAETLRRMVDSFNQVLQSSFAPRALGWRLEAWRTGRPFAEVVLSHSLIYRVEQVFLVHRKSGLLLQHVAADQVATQDGDLISGMLTAIQDFVRDSFAVDGEEAVDTMRVGDLTVWVVQGEESYVAALIRGGPPANLREVLRDAVETIHLEFAEAFEAFSGDTAPFEGTRQHLEGCLQMQVGGRQQRRYWLAPVIVGGVVLLLAATWFLLAAHADRRWSAYLARLQSEPGIVVVHAEGGVRRSSISGLRDQFAADPAGLLGEYGLNPERVTARWAPFQSNDAEMVKARATSALVPPPGVTFGYAGGTLTVTGPAPHPWVVDLKRRAPALPGVERLALDSLVDTGMVRIAPAREKVEAAILRFDIGSAELPTREEPVFDATLAAMEELAAAAREAAATIRVEALGRSDGTGSERTNVRLARARAEWAVSALEGHGLRGLTFSVVGVGASLPLRPDDSAENRAHNRSVTFRVLLDS